MLAERPEKSPVPGPAGQQHSIHPEIAAAVVVLAQRQAFPPRPKDFQDQAMPAVCLDLPAVGFSIVCLESKLYLDLAAEPPPALAPAGQQHSGHHPQAFGFLALLAFLREAPVLLHSDSITLEVQLVLFPVA